MSLVSDFLRLEGQLGKTGRVLVVETSVGESERRIGLC